MKRMHSFHCVGLALVMGWACTGVLASTEGVTPHVPKADDEPAVVIYTSSKEGNPEEDCTIPFENNAVDFTDNIYGCTNDEASYFALKNVPSAAKIWLLSEKDCKLTNDADWLFELKTTVKRVTTDPIRIKGMYVYLQHLPAVITKGVQLISGHVHNVEHVDGKLSCVRIERSEQDTSTRSSVERQDLKPVKEAEYAAPRTPGTGAQGFINFYKKEEGNLDCVIPITTYVHHFIGWTGDDGYQYDADNPNGCTNDDIYSLELNNVPSSTRIYLSSDADCTLSQYSNWNFKLKTTQQSVTSTGIILLSDLAEQESGKPLPPPHKGILAEDIFHRNGTVGGKLSCVQIIAPIQDSSVSGQ